MTVGAIKPFPLELWLCELIEFSPDDPKKYYLSALQCGLNFKFPNQNHV